MDPSQAKPTAPSSGNMDDDIELQYTPQRWSKKFSEQEIVDNYDSVASKASAISKKEVPCKLDISYGKSEKQKADIFGAEALPEGAPIFVFIHGGSWTFGCREESSHFAKTFFEAGIVSIILGYDLVTDTNKIRIPDIVQQIVDGIKFSLDYAAKRKSKGVYICGHSAGAHLTITAVSSGSFNNEQSSLIKGVILMGALYDISPLLKHRGYKDAKITREIVDLASPMHLIDKLAQNVNSGTKFLIVTCEQEAPPYQEQSQKYEKALQDFGLKSQFLKICNEDHFSMGLRLVEKDYSLTKAIFNMIHPNKA